MAVYKKHFASDRNFLRNLFFVGFICLSLMTIGCGGGYSEYPEQTTVFQAGQYDNNFADQQNQQNVYRGNQNFPPADSNNPRGQAAYSQRNYQDPSSRQPRGYSQPPNNPDYSSNTTRQKPRQVSYYEIYEPSNPSANSQGYVYVRAGDRPENSDRPNSRPSNPVVSVSRDEQQVWRLQQGSQKRHQDNYNQPAQSNYNKMAASQQKPYDYNQPPPGQTAPPTISNVGATESTSSTDGAISLNRRRTQRQSQQQSQAGSYSSESIAKSQPHESLTVRNPPGGKYARTDIPAVKVSIPGVSQIEQTSSITNQIHATVQDISQNDSRQTQVVASENTEKEIIANMEHLLAQNPSDLAYQMALRLLYSRSGNSDKAISQMASLSPEQRADSLTLAQAIVLATQSKSNPANPALTERAMEAIRQLADQFAANADLKISTMEICSSVQGFGQYQVIPKEQLQTARSSDVLVYCELENFKHKLNTDGKYQTRLQADITLYDAGMRPLAQVSGEVKDEPSFNRRRDYFIRVKLNIPQLAPGKYEIVAYFEDKIAKTRARPRRYTFEVAEQISY